jgi:5-methyltetrahydrofolate--homocysteine methyltransferase
MPWKMLYNTWLSSGQKSVQAELKTDAEAMLNKWIKEKNINPSYIVGTFPANSIENEILIFDTHTKAELVRLNTARNFGDKTLASFIAPLSLRVTDYVGCFAATVGNGVEKTVSEYQQQGDMYSALLAQSLADCLAEALSEYLHNKVKNEYWQFSRKGIRPAVGYTVYPLHSEKAKIFKLLNADKIITLTENYAMSPQASVCGLYFANADNYNLNKQ